MLSRKLFQVKIPACQTFWVDTAIEQCELLLVANDAGSNKCQKLELITEICIKFVGIAINS